MKTKVCTKCGLEKDISEFYKNSNKNGFRPNCKICHNKESQYYYQLSRSERIKYTKDYYKLYPWKKTLHGIKQRCEKKNHKYYKYYGGRGIKCLITVEELKELWFRDKAYELKRPSIDRIDDNGDYTFENCRYIELKNNIRKTKVISILQFDLNENFIKEWDSSALASQILGISNIALNKCLKKVIKTSAGFIWKYK